MGGIGGMELLVIGLVALIVVGPKDLPGMFRTLGQFTAKAKRMGREFTSAMEAAADDAGVSDVTNTLRDVTNPKKMGLDAVKKAVDLDPNSETGKLAAERAAAKDKILAKAAETASARQAKEAAAADAAAKPKATKPKTAAKKAPAKKAPAKTATAKAAAAKPKAKAVAKPKAKPKTTTSKTPKAKT